MAESFGGDIGTRILKAVEGLGAQMTRLESRVDDLGRRMAEVESELAVLRFQMQLRGDSHKVRTEVEAELQRLRAEKDEGLRRLDARINLTDSVVILVAGELRRPREFGDQLQTRLRNLEAR